MCSNHNVIIMNDQIANGSGGEILPQRLPVITIVKREVNRVLRPGKDQSFSQRIFTNRVHRLIGRNSLSDFLPSLPPIMTAVDIGMEIIQAESVHSCIDGI